MIGRSARHSALGLVFALGCTSASAVEERAVITAIEQLRDAPAEDLEGRKRLIDVLEKKPAPTPEAERARDSCASAYRLLVEGKEGVASVQRWLGRPSEAPKTLLADLAAAEEKLEQSEEALPSCEKAAAELRLRRR